jgi:hypothetical protein
MPEDFQSLIPKIHPRLKDMINFWERFVIFREKAETPADKIYEHVMKRSDFICEICYAPMQNNHDIVKHIRNVHSDLIDGYVPGEKRP